MHKNQILNLILISMLALSVSYPQNLAAGNPKPSHSDFVSDIGGGFLIQDKTLRYGMTFQFSNELPRPLYVVIEFDNPMDKSSKLVSHFVVEQDTLVAQSDPIPSAKHRKTYKLKMYVYSDESHSELLTTHKSKVKFNLPPDLAEQLGIELL